MGRPSISSTWLHVATAAAAAALIVLAVTAPPVGAAGSPTLVKDINPAGSSYPSYLTQVGSTLFFAATDGVHGTELWKSDGTAAGTRMVKDIHRYSRGSDPQDLVNFNGTLFFTAVDGTHGHRLWKSDGTAAGTVMMDEGTASSTAAQLLYCPGDMLYPPVVAGNHLFYFPNPTGCARGPVYIGVTDGTNAGTHYLDAAVADYFEQGPVAVALGNKLYFISDPDEGDGGIWVTDGTNAGTHRLAGQPAAGSCMMDDYEGGISFLPAHGQNLYFTCQVGYGSDNIQLWKSNGTRAGTKPLTDAGELRSVPTEAVLMGKSLYFNSRYEADSPYAEYGQLWKTNGTGAGTSPVETWKNGYDNGNLTTSGGRLFLTVNDHLWRSDGTTAGTTDLGKFGAETPTDLIAVGSKVCFAETDADAGTWSLWKSNGTKSGTYKVGTFAGGEVEQATVGSNLFFAANDITHGMELWSYNP